MLYRAARLIEVQMQELSSREPKSAAPGARGDQRKRGFDVRDPIRGSLDRDEGFEQGRVGLTHQRSTREASDIVLPRLDRSSRRAERVMTKGAEGEEGAPCALVRASGQGEQLLLAFMEREARSLGEGALRRGALGDPAGMCGDGRPVLDHGLAKRRRRELGPHHI